MLEKKKIHHEKWVVLSGICLLIFSPFVFLPKSKKHFFLGKIVNPAPLVLSAHTFLKSVEVLRFNSTFFFFKSKIFSALIKWGKAGQAEVEMWDSQ